MNVELGAFLTACKAFKVAEAAVGQIISWSMAMQWQFPSQSEKTISDLPSLIKEMCQGKTDITIRCGASQLLTVFPVLRHYIDTEILPDKRLSVHRASLRLAFEMVSALHAVTRTRMSSHNFIGLPISQGSFLNSLQTC